MASDSFTETPQSGDDDAAKTGRLPPGMNNPVDVHVGSRLKLRRVLLGLSQEKLGDGVGLTFQQIQKYERGANRIGASRLYQFSEILDVPVSYFFEEMPDEIKTRQGAYAVGIRTGADQPGPIDPMVRRETLELVRNYYRITAVGVRRQIFELTRSIARSETDAPDSG